MINLSKNHKYFFIDNEEWDIGRINTIPDISLNKNKTKWQVPVDRTCVLKLKSLYSDNEFSLIARQKCAEILNTGALTPGFPKWFKFKTNPMIHQKQALDKMWGKFEFALFMEMRTGKTWTAINWASALAQDGRIDGLLVVCPTAVKLIWEEELEMHCPIDYECFVMMMGKNKKSEQFIFNTEIQGLKVYVAGIESFSNGQGAALAEKFASTHRIAMVIDESETIKNHDKIRTKKCTAIGGISQYRLAMTGTPISEGIHNFYSQFRFLNWKIIGHKSYYTFKAEHCIMGGFEGRKVVGYRHVGELMDKIEPYTFQVNTRDVIDLPEEIYTKRIVEPSKEQAKILKDLRDPFDMRTVHNGKVLEPETVLERMVRYQQIAGGTFPYDIEDEESKEKHGYDYIAGTNPKLEELMVVLGQLHSDRKVIIWARYKPEIEIIVDRLVKHYGKEAIAEFSSRCDYDERKVNKKKFNTDSHCKFLVTTQVIGARGQEFAAASVHVYFSHSFSYVDRKQSIYRTHSKHQKAESILIIDILLNHKIDKDIVKALDKKQSIADYVRGELAQRGNIK